jgi:chromosome segregation ATPase
MSINVKKYTKEQMAKMVEEATERQEAAEAEATAHFKAGVKLAEENEKLRGEIGTLTEQLDQMHGEAITRENAIANLKADADCLRNNLDATEAALGRANACIVTMKVERDQQTKDLFEWRRSAQNLHDDLLNARERAHYAEAHPWRNLWAWVKRKLGGERNEHVS